MKPRYIPAFVTLAAGTVTCLISIIKKFEILYSLKVLLIILVIFYIIGCIAKSIITKVIVSASVKEKDEISESVDSENEIADITTSAEESEATASTQ